LSRQRNKPWGHRPAAGDPRPVVDPRPTRDEAARPGGTACTAKAWKPGDWYPGGKPGLSLVLTEFADPGCEFAYSMFLTRTTRVRRRRVDVLRYATVRNMKRRSFLGYVSLGAVGLGFASRAKAETASPPAPSGDRLAKRLPPPSDDLSFATEAAHAEEDFDFIKAIAQFLAEEKLVGNSI